VSEHDHPGCPLCDERDREFVRMHDELVRRRLADGSTSYVPPGTASRHLRLLLDLGRIRRPHLDALRAQSDPLLQDLYRTLADMTGGRRHP
jgi:hypothetical protein